MKKTKKLFSLSVLSLVLCVSMLVGTTFAWFTDSVTSGVNTITAGNLDIDVLAGGTSIENQESLFQTTNWEPGVISYQNFTVQNKGTLAAKIKFNLDVMDENTLNGKGLSQVIKVAYLDGQTFSGDRTAAQALTYASLADLSSEFNLDANSTKNIAVVLYWQPTDNDNDWNVNNGKTTSDGQPLYINIAVNAVATQQTAETDSFDNQYDAAATYPILAALVNRTDNYGGSFAQNKVATGTGDSTQVTAKEAITLENDESVTLIPAGTTLFKANGTADEAITTENDNQEGYTGSIVSNIKTKESKADSVTYQISYTYKEGDTSTSVSKFSEIVTNIFDLSTGLKNVKVTTTHNGGSETELTSLESNVATDKSFYYDSATGKLYIYSSTYSDFKVTYESDYTAALSGQGYLALADAIKAAKAGETITVLKDCETGSGYTMESPLVLTAANVTLNLNGKTITTTNNFTFVIAGDNDIVKNGTIKSGERRANDGSTVTTDGPLYRGYPIVVAATASAGSVNGVQVNDVTIYGGISAGGSIENNYTSIQGAGNVTLTDCTIKEGAAYALYAQLGSTLNVADGTYSAGKSGLASAESGSTISITGGTFNADPSAYVANGYIALKMTGTSGDTWTVTEKIVDNTEVLITKTGVDDQYMSLAAFRDSVNADNTYEGYTVTLQKNVDLGNEEWEPIKKFSGEFDGQGYSISGLKINSSKDNDHGLFAEIAGGYIHDLTISGEITISYANNCAGSIAGKLNGGVIKNITSNVNITSSTYGRLGGIIGSSKNVAGQKIEGCINNGTITNGTSTETCTGGSAGGIIGQIMSEIVIKDCTNNGNVTTITNQNGAGGIIGHMKSKGNTPTGSYAFTSDSIYLINLNNTGTISAPYAVCGAIIGKFGDGDNSGWNNFTGISASIQNLSNSGNCSGNQTGLFIGGLGGVSYHTFKVLNNSTKDITASISNTSATQMNIFGNWTYGENTFSFVSDSYSEE